MDMKSKCAGTLQKLSCSAADLDSTIQYKFTDPYSPESFILSGAKLLSEASQPTSPLSPSRCCRLGKKCSATVKASSARNPFYHSRLTSVFNRTPSPNTHDPRPRSIGRHRPGFITPMPHLGTETEARDPQCRPPESAKNIASNAEPGAPATHYPIDGAT